MDTRLLHTPEGVRDIYNKECQDKLYLQNRVHATFASYGYRDIQTPTFEFFDIFSREVGTTPSKDLYKFFDREGNTLVLRPDFTPSIARSAAKYYLEEDDSRPVRLCYSGNTFINETEAYRGRLKETTQMGVELISDAAVESDAELIAMAVEALLSAGLDKFQIEIGQVQFFKGLLKEAGISEEDGEELRKMIAEKNFFGVDQFLAAKNVALKQQEIFQKLPQAFGGIELLAEAKSWTTNEKSLRAIARLEKIYELLTYYGYAHYITFDLGMLNKYTYYTGIIFQAYTYGTGEALVSGGRYDNLMQYFGKEAPAIGFVVFVDQLMNALHRQNVEIPTTQKQQVLYYEASQFTAVLQEAKALRQQGICVEMIQATTE